MGLWVGTYSGKGGKGLYPLSIDADVLRVGEPTAAIANASYGAWNRRAKVVYFTDEQDAGRVTAWHRREGKWEAVSASGSGGSAPCHLALNPAGDRLAVANYADGSIGLLSLDRTTGQIGELVDRAQPTGRGHDPERQQGPHAHCVCFSESGDRLYHVDLGLDRILTYPIDTGRLGEPIVALTLPPGSGPRHLLLHPDGKRALLLCELSAELYLLERKGPEFGIVHSLPTTAILGSNLGGHLFLSRSGDRAVVSNRGCDTIVSFAIKGPAFHPEGEISTRGVSPRHFWSDGKHAIVAHEESGSVVRLNLAELGSGRRGHLAIEVPGAAFVIDIPE